eukprot:scaffold20458_cov38-Phaeocystis_antarctica.AAC.2
MTPVRRVAARPRATRRRGLASGTILRRGLGVHPAATTAASKRRQDRTNRRAPEASRRRCLSSKQLQRFDGKHRSLGPRRLAPPSAKYETLPRCWCVKLPTDRTAQTRRLLVAYAVAPLSSEIYRDARYACWQC